MKSDLLVNNCIQIKQWYNKILKLELVVIGRISSTVVARGGIVVQCSTFKKKVRKNIIITLFDVKL